MTLSAGILATSCGRVVLAGEQEYLAGLTISGLALLGLTRFLPAWAATVVGWVAYLRARDVRWLSLPFVGIVGWANLELLRGWNHCQTPATVIEQLLAMLLAVGVIAIGTLVLHAVWKPESSQERWISSFLVVSVAVVTSVIDSLYVLWALLALVVEAT